MSVHLIWVVCGCSLLADWEKEFNKIKQETVMGDNESKI